MIARRIREITGVDRKVTSKGLINKRKVEFIPPGIPSNRAKTSEIAKPSKPLLIVVRREGQKPSLETTSKTARSVFSGEGISCSESVNRLISFQIIKRRIIAERLMRRFFVIKFFIGQFTTNY
jgi:hypothetical protein